MGMSHIVGDIQGVLSKPLHASFITAAVLHLRFRSRAARVPGRELLVALRSLHHDAGCKQWQLLCWLQGSWWTTRLMNLLFKAHESGCTVAKQTDQLQIQAIGTRKRLTETSHDGDQVRIGVVHRVDVEARTWQG